MGNIGVLGEKESVIGYRAIGLEAVFCSTREQAAAGLAKMAEAGYKIIFIVEETAALIESEIAKYRQAKTPAIILVPGSRGSLGLGKKMLQDSVEKAVGSNILENQ